MTLEADTFNAYIDGFNLYKGALEPFPEYKWLNLISLCKTLMPSKTLGQIYYFTASVKERYKGDDAPRRQHTYLRVLESQGIKVIRGQFRKDQYRMRIVSNLRADLLEPQLPSHFGFTQAALDKSARIADPDSPRAHVYKMEEKGSDVNLASYLLRDSFKANMDAALVITGDSDLVTPIKFAVQEGVSVKVLVPNRFLKAGALEDAATSIEKLNPLLLAEHQLQNPYLSPNNTSIFRPGAWT